MRRNRILRNTAVIRNMVAETHLNVSQFIVPLFIVEGTDIVEPIASMPGYNRYSLDMLKNEIDILWQLGLTSVLLFTKVENNLKDEQCTEALNENGLMARSIKMIKKHIPEMCVMTDVALDPFSPYGHDGIIKNGIIVNDETVGVLAQMSVMHAKMGADFVAPSDMMDFRILKIRQALEENKFNHTGIVAYSAKYASCFYGPFRVALDSAPGFGDKKTYQMDLKNRREAIKETLQDIEEGADMVVIKPAGAYLDIIREIKNIVKIPVIAYQVSGEYSMIKAAAQQGWLNETDAIIETLTAIKRAGADIIITYFAKDYVKILNDEHRKK